MFVSLCACVFLCVYVCLNEREASGERESKDVGMGERGERGQCERECGGWNEVEEREREERERRNLEMERERVRQGGKGGDSEGEQERD